jgi:hypothetical protein
MTDHFAKVRVQASRFRCCSLLLRDLYMLEFVLDFVKLYLFVN